SFAQSFSEQFKRLDRNNDGKIDATELRRPQFFERFDQNGDGVIERSELFRPSPSDPADSASDRTLTPVASPLISFTRDYLPGGFDTEGNFMGGTETMRIVAHDGKLFAGNGYWTDQPGDDPRPGAQILIKEGENQPWRVSKNYPRSVRISAIESITFRTDYKGTDLDPPVTLLVADAGLATARSSGPLFVHVFDEESEDWIPTKIGEDIPRAYVRAFGAHEDVEMGIDHIFAGTGGGEVYRGAYDPDAPGKLRWDRSPEYTNPDFEGGAFKRCQGFCVANGKLYASISPRLLERIDGPEPRWLEVFRWNPEQRAGAGLRGITAVPSPTRGHEVILGSREQEGRILRIDPLNNYRVSDELLSQDFLKEHVGPDFRGGKLVAYNRFIPGKHPRTGEPIHWVTVAGIKLDDRHAGWLLIRNADASYEPIRVYDDSLGESHPILVSTRTLAFAPWNENEVYTGGFDGAANDRKNHNSAWIFRGILGGALEGGPDDSFAPSTQPTLSPNEVRDAEYYFPLMWAPAYYNKDGQRENDDICLRRLDPKTGGFVPVEDHQNSPDCIVLAEDIGRKGAQGPELARSRDGFFVLFNRQVDDKHEVWRTSPFGLDPTSAPIEVVKVASDPTKAVTQVMHTRGHELGRVGIMLSAGRGTQYGFLEEVEGDRFKLRDLPYRKRGDKARWLPDSYRLTFVGEVEPDNRQIVVVDASDDSHEVISDPDTKRNYETATPFRSPEFPGETLIAATAENEIVVLRDTDDEHWEELRILESP
ncbi:MAG: EF-hand domain-containing protein, partial [Verrucomicrobiota bacterium]